MASLKTFALGVNMITAVLITIAMYGTHTYKQTQLFNILVENLFNALSWVLLVLIILEVCIIFL